ncbi:MAG: hypothetical protein J6L64_08785 [Opitutales bacterium]|nr:hypothetical protein [Opitutales bacterium]
MEKIEILDNGEMRDVEPRAAADVAARFEALDAERRVHYAAMAAAGVLPEEAPFPREREWRKLRDGDGRPVTRDGSGADAHSSRGMFNVESLNTTHSTLNAGCDRKVVSPLNRAAGVLTVLAIPGIGVFFGLMAAFAMIAEEGGF